MGTSQKVAGATGGSVVGGALSVVLLYCLGTYAHFSPPPEVAGAITLLIGSVTTFAAGWLTPHGTPQPPPTGGTS